MVFAESDTGCRLPSVMTVFWFNCVRVSFFIDEPYCILFVAKSLDIIVVVSFSPSARDQIYSQEGQDAASEEFSKSVRVRRGEVSVQDRTSDDDGNGEEDELNGNDLCRVEALKCTVDVSYLC